MSSRWPRRVVVATLALLAIAGFLVTVSWEQAKVWWDAAPHRAVTLEDDGTGTIGNLRIGLDRIEPSEALVASEEEVAAPDGWVLWLATFDVEVLAGVEEMESSWLDVSVVASDRKIYTRSRAFEASTPPGGWFDMAPDESGPQQDMVLLPEGVEPVRVRVVPTPRNPFWSFPVDR